MPAVPVRFNNYEASLKNLRKKMQREGVYKHLKLSFHHEKPSEKKARKKQESIRRNRKSNRKISQND